MSHIINIYCVYSWQALLQVAGDMALKETNVIPVLKATTVQSTRNTEVAVLKVLQSKVITGSKI